MAKFEHLSLDAASSPSLAPSLKAGQLEPLASVAGGESLLQLVRVLLCYVAMAMPQGMMQTYFLWEEEKVLPNFCENTPPPTTHTSSGDQANGGGEERAESAVA